MDELKIKYGLNIVERSNCLPNRINNNDNNFGRYDKIGEYREKYFIARDDEKYEDPGTIIAYSYSGLYYPIKEHCYYYLHKIRHLRLEDDSSYEYDKKTKLGGNYEISIFNRNAFFTDTNSSTEGVLELLGKIYDEHVNKMKIKKEKKVQRDAIMKERAIRQIQREQKKITKALESKSGYNENWSGIVL